jgi:hypothetical protein
MTRSKQAALLPRSFVLPLRPLDARRIDEGDVGLLTLEQLDRLKISKLR